MLQPARDVWWIASAFPNQENSSCSWLASCLHREWCSRPDVGGLVEWRIDRPPIMRDDAVRNKSLVWSFFFLLTERLVYWANRVSGRLSLCALVVNVIEKNWPSALLQWETCCVGDWLLEIGGKGTFHHAGNGFQDKSTRKSEFECFLINRNLHEKSERLTCRTVKFETCRKVATGAIRSGSFTGKCSGGCISA